MHFRPVRTMRLSRSPSLFTTRNSISPVRSSMTAGWRGGLAGGASSGGLTREGGTFSGNGMGFGAFFSGSADSLCLMRFAAEGEEGSSSALRFGPGDLHQHRGYRRVSQGEPMSGEEGARGRVPSSFILEDIAGGWCRACGLPDRWIATAVDGARWSHVVAFASRRGLGGGIWQC